MFESIYSVAGGAVPESPGIQALLDTSTTQWNDISDAGLDMLPGTHLTPPPTEQPTNNIDTCTMQIDTGDRTLIRSAVNFNAPSLLSNDYAYTSHNISR